MPKARRVDRSIIVAPNSNVTSKAPIATHSHRPRHLQDDESASRLPWVSQIPTSKAGRAAPTMHVNHHPCMANAILAREDPTDAPIKPDAMKTVVILPRACGASL